MTCQCGAEMNHIDLFSGIGGFAYAAQQVWGEEHNIVAFCEINKYCQQVLKKHWKDVPICEDIRSLNYEFIANTKGRKSGKSTQQEGWKDTGGGDFKIDLLTGGFPCQPFSVAGKKRGKNDDRYLWPEMLRVIKEFKPRWIVGENVGGLINQSHMEQPDSEPEMGGETDNEECCDEDSTAGGVLHEIIDSLEQIGYSVQTFVIPACAINAPHRRDRIWIVAHSTSDRCNLRKCDRKRRQVQDPAEWEVAEDKQERNGWVNRIGKTHDVSSDTRRKYGERTTVNGEPERTVSCEEATVMLERPTCDDGKGIDSDTHPRRQEKQEQQTTGDKQCGGDDTDTNNKGMERQFRKPRETERTVRKTPESGYCPNSWEQNWLEVATELCQLDDGLPVELDGFKLSKAGHRVERLKALGSAIVPQVAIEIFKAIKMAENT